MSENPYQEQSDDELLQAIVEENSCAFEIFYQRYEHRLYQYLFITTNDASMAEDLFVEVMITVWEEAKTFQGNSQVSTWMWSIARNKALDFLRLQTRIAAKHQNYEMSRQNHKPVENPETKVGQLMLREAIQQTLQGLPQEHQIVVFMVYYEEMSYQEVATHLEIPLNTVKSRMFSAKRKLKEFFQDLGIQEEL